MAKQLWSHWQWTKINNNLTFASSKKTYGSFATPLFLLFILQAPFFIPPSISPLPFLLLSPPPSSFLLFLFFFLVPFLLFLSRLYPQRSSLLSLKWYHDTGIISFHEAATALEGIEEEVSGTSISIGPTWVLHLAVGIQNSCTSLILFHSGI